MKASSTFSWTVRNPSARRVMVGADLVYQGSFRFPHQSGPPSSFTYRKFGICFNPSTGGLFVGGYNGGGYAPPAPEICEIKMPSALGKATAATSAQLGALPVCTITQPFADITQGLDQQVRASPPTSSDWPCCGGMMVYQGLLYSTWWPWYPGNVNVYRPTFVISSTNLSAPNAKGMYGVNVGTLNEAVSAGGPFPIPASFQSLFGFPAFCGRCGGPNAERSSIGPAFVAFDPATLGPTLCSSKTFLFYPTNNPAFPPVQAGQGWLQNTRGAALTDLGTKYGLIYCANEPLGYTWYGDATTTATAPGPPVPAGLVDPCNPARGTHSSAGQKASWCIYDPYEVVNHLNTGGNPEDFMFSQFDVNAAGDNPWLALPCATIGDMCETVPGTYVLLQNGVDCQTIGSGSGNYSYPVGHVYKAA